MTAKTEHLATAAQNALGIEIAGLYDCARISRELRISRRAAEAIMRELPKQYLPNLRKTYVRGGDLATLLDENVVAA